MLDQERAAAINIGGQTYNMVLTTLATKEISKRYGGLEQLGEKLLKTENFELALDEVVFLITLLCNQGIMIENLMNPNAPCELLSEQTVELLTTPNDLMLCKDAIIAAMVKGTKRFVESEPVKSKTYRPGRRGRVLCPTDLYWRVPVRSGRA